MKYCVSSGHLQQKALIELGLDLIDAEILNYVIRFHDTGRMKKIIHDKKEFFWVKLETVRKELPILGINNNEVMAKRFKKYVRCGLMESHVKRSGGVFTCFRFVSDKLIKLLEYDQEEINADSKSTDKSVYLTNESEKEDTKSILKTEQTDSKIDLVLDQIDSKVETKDPLTKNSFNKNHHQVDNDNLNLINQLTMCQLEESTTTFFENSVFEEKSLKEIRITPLPKKKTEYKPDEPDLFNQCVPVNNTSEIEFELRRYGLDSNRIKKIINHNELEYIKQVIRVMLWLQSQGKIQSPAKFLHWAFMTKDQMLKYIKDYQEAKRQEQKKNQIDEKEMKDKTFTEDKRIQDNYLAYKNDLCRKMIDEMDQQTLDRYKNEAKKIVDMKYGVNHPAYSIMLDVGVNTLIENSINFTLEDFLKSEELVNKITTYKNDCLEIRVNKRINSYAMATG